MVWTDKTGTTKKGDTGTFVDATSVGYTNAAEYGALSIDTRINVVLWAVALTRKRIVSFVYDPCEIR
jgi:hypothetical protein